MSCACCIGGDPATSSNKKSIADEYNLGDELGEGAFSKVRLATSKTTSQKFAVKIVTKKKLTPDDAQGLKQEISILQELDHPNIMTLKEVFVEPNFIYLITELLSGGELFDRIVQKEYYDESEARNVSRIMFGALEYCHDRKVAHRDLKPENLLLTSKFDDNNIKVADFGFAKKSKSDHSLMTQCGTPGYVAPEIIKGTPYGTQVDMWSLGVILYILLAGYPPFNGKTQKELFKQIRRGRYHFHEQFWGGVSEDAKDLVRHLLVVDAEKRYTAKMALGSTWMVAVMEKGMTHKASMEQFRRFNAKRKVKQAVLAHLAAKKMSHFVGLGEDATFMFTHGKNNLPGVDQMDYQ